MGKKNRHRVIKIAYRIYLTHRVLSVRKPNSARFTGVLLRLNMSVIIHIENNEVKRERRLENPERPNPNLRTFRTRKDQVDVNRTVPEDTRRTRNS